MILDEKFYMNLTVKDVQNSNFTEDECFSIDADRLNVQVAIEMHKKYGKYYKKKSLNGKELRKRTLKIFDEI
jgi:hypothetical protein